MTEVCGAIQGPGPSKCSCKRPEGHPGEHVDEHGSQWPYTSVEIIAQSQAEQGK